jgi:hypothetical protein
MTREKAAEYLGTILTDAANNGVETNNRISKATWTANELGIFWNKANTTTKWKLRVFEAIIKSRLLYGLEKIQLTQPEQQPLNAFQMKGLIRILHIPPSSVDRTWTNQTVLERLKEEHEVILEPFDVTWKKAES